MRLNAAPGAGPAERSESRVPALLAILTAIALQVLLPDRLVVLRPRYVLPGLELALLVPLVLSNPVRLTRESRDLRWLSLLLLAVIGLADVLQLGELMRLLLFGGGQAGSSQGRELIRAASQVWLTNAVVFAVGYWELDRGGPFARIRREGREPDFQFPQQADGGAYPDWTPGFVDYLYVSFTNQTAFSPTDTMPLTARVKLLMLAQGTASLVTVTIVAARAVNVLS